MAMGNVAIGPLRYKSFGLCDRYLLFTVGDGMQSWKAVGAAGTPTRLYDCGLLGGEYTCLNLSWQG
jgi:hypothetical protein